MKKLAVLYIVILLLFTGCAQKIIVNRYTKTDDGSLMMVGRQDRSAFKHESFYIWYKKEYDSYKPDAKIVEKLTGEIDDYEIEIFLGSWCGDSKREVPRFLKILDEAQFPEKQLKIYAVTRKKESFYGEEQGKNIIRVPTFIFYEKGKRYSKTGKREINRIIESPVDKKLENDMLKIIMKKSYIPNYYF